MTAERTILINGAAGFLGGYAAGAFAAAGWRVVGADRNSPEERPHPAHPEFAAFERLDVSHRNRMREVILRHGPDLVLHLAAGASVEASAEDPAGDFESQCIPLIRTLETLRGTGSPARFLLVSSAAVYGEPRELPVDEQALPKPISPYGFHKLAQEAILHEFAALAGLRFCVARVFSTYGEGLRRLAVWEITRRAMKGDFSIRGSGRESRDYLHASDVGRAFVCLAAAARFESEIVNVGSGEETSLVDLATLIYGALGHSGRMPICDNRPSSSNPRHWRAGVDLLRANGFRATIPLGEGILSTVRWIRSHD